MDTNAIRSVLSFAKKPSAALRQATRVCWLCALAATFTTYCAAQVFSNLVTFDYANGASPSSALVQGSDGNLYGTTDFYGSSCCGTVFRMTPNGTLTTIYSFCGQANCTDGADPRGGLVPATDQNFYGTTATGGTQNAGTVFKITPQGKLTTLYSFCAQLACADGQYPVGALIEASNGNFYGATQTAGAHEAGTIFKITSHGKLTTLYSFCALSSCADGSTPMSGLIRGTDGNLYGTTSQGGNNGPFSCPNGCGTVFKIVSTGTLTTLHSFDFTDGDAPTAALIQASNGRFYGSTFFGGTVLDVCGQGCGTIFAITPKGVLNTQVKFEWNNGDGPSSALIQATDGNLYGTTAVGVGYGTVFKMSPEGRLTILYTFYGGPSGESPYGGVVQATNGTFYGTTEGNGTEAIGTVYSLSVGLGPFVSFVIPTGKPGQTAQILGQGLIGTTSVTFNGVAAINIKIVSDTYLTVVVPRGATSGKVVVTTPSGTLTSNVNFNVTK